MGPGVRHNVTSFGDASGNMRAVASPEHRSAADDDSLRLLICTAPEATAVQLARALLDARLIACVNVVPDASSLYWWQGAIVDELEAVMLMETTRDRAAAAVARLETLHPYEVPKILTLAPTANPAYLAWLREVTTPVSPD